jgi:hypothetical protein
VSKRDYENWPGDRGWAPATETGIVLQTDLAPAQWLTSLLLPGTFEVRMTAPQGFEAYARVFFPFVGSDVVRDGEVVDQEHVTWTEMARQNGRIAHALTEQETIASEPQTCYGDLSDEQFTALLPVLERHTASTSGWFLVWDGFGDLSDSVFDYRAAQLRHPTRSYYLLRGPLASYGDLPHDPNYWWPDDRAWCWSTDTDFSWGYLAGTVACIDQVLAMPTLDAFLTRPENPACSGMDDINDPGRTVPRLP